uniref:Uncharacterized protein n=1 Tax=Syphacia muris TaxID=451379 RepID=A0A0N5AQD1_9BILA
MTYTELTKLLDRLETGKYHWEPSNQQRQKRQVLSLPKLTPISTIPSSGPLLESELPSIKNRLNKIAEDLRELRSHRLHLSSAEFFATMGPTSSTRTPQSTFSMKQSTTLQSLKNRLEEIDAEKLTDEKEPSKDEITITKADELFQKYRNTIRRPISTEEMPEKSDDATSEHGQNFPENKEEKKTNNNEKAVRFQRSKSNSLTITTKNEQKLSDDQQKTDIAEQATKQETDTKDDIATSSYQKLLNMIRNENNDDKSDDDDDDFDPTFSYKFNANKSKQNSEKTVANSSDTKSKNNNLDGSFLGATQLENSMDTDSDATPQHPQTPSAINDLDSDSEFFG